jgi:HTH-type transcriptional regulator/antitoxin HigA
MQLRPVRTRREYSAALKEVEVLWNAAEGSAEEVRLLELVRLIEAYERRHFPVPAPGERCVGSTPTS